MRTLRSLTVATVLSLGLVAAGATGADADAGTWPVLDVAHAVPTGGMNLWEVPLHGRPPTFEDPILVTTLEAGGFRYAQSRTFSGNFGDVSGQDDGSPDWLIVHEQPNGGVLFWVVGGGPDPTPHLWADLRSGGWSYANSRQMVGDVDGDGTDDIVSVHRNHTYDGRVWSNIWVHRTNGSGLSSDPELWAQVQPDPYDFTSAASVPFVDSRYVLGDANGDGRDDLTVVHRGWAGSMAIAYRTWLSTGTSFPAPTGFTWGDGFEGWSFDNSRDLVADLNGDGRDDLVNVHRQPNGGVLVWARYFGDEWSAYSLPGLKTDLRDGGWSWEGSRQVAADVDGDDDDDIVSIHDQVGGGELVWAHLSDRYTAKQFPPTVIADLRTGGWDFRTSREDVGLAR